MVYLRALEFSGPGKVYLWRYLWPLEVCLWRCVPGRGLSMAFIALVEVIYGPGRGLALEEVIYGLICGALEEVCQWPFQAARAQLQRRQREGNRTGLTPCVSMNKGTGALLLNEKDIQACSR